MTNVILKPNQAVTLLLQCCIVLYCRHFDFATSKHFGIRDTDKKMLFYSSENTYLLGG